MANKKPSYVLILFEHLEVICYVSYVIACIDNKKFNNQCGHITLQFLNKYPGWPNLIASDSEDG